MSDINFNFTVNDSLSANFTVDPAPQANFNISDPIQANFYIEGGIPIVTGGVSQIIAGSNISITPSAGTGIVTINAVASGSPSVTQVGGNGGGLGFNLSGNVTTTGNLTLSAPDVGSLRTTLSIGSVANANFIGDIDQTLRGDGTWGPTGSTGNVGDLNLTGNTQQWLRGDGTFMNIAIPTGNVANMNFNGNANTWLRGNGTWANIAVPTGNIANINLNGNVNQALRGDGTWGLAGSTGNVGNLNLNGNTQQWLRGDGTFANIAVPTGNIANINLNGNGNQVLVGNGTWVNQGAGSPGGSNTQVQFNNANTFGGMATLTYDATIATPKIKQFKEAVIITGNGLGATANFDVLSGAIVYYNANATANTTLNIRGNSTITLNNSMAVGESLSITLLTTVGANAYSPSVLQIDNSNITPVWAGGSGAGVVGSNGIYAYSFNIIKTAANTYTTFGSQVRFA